MNPRPHSTTTQRGDVLRARLDNRSRDLAECYRSVVESGPVEITTPRDGAILPDGDVVVPEAFKNDPSGD